MARRRRGVWTLLRFFWLGTGTSHRTRGRRLRAVAYRGGDEYARIVGADAGSWVHPRARRARKRRRS